MSKYQQYFQNMLKTHQELFDQFTVIHQNYQNDPLKYQKEFDEVGRDVQDVVRKYENLLCAQSEGSGYSRYSSNLAEKFQKEVKILFPKIDCVGLEESK
jgi:hypothetical protein